MSTHCAEHHPLNDTSYSSRRESEADMAFEPKDTVASSGKGSVYSSQAEPVHVSFSEGLEVVPGGDGLPVRETVHSEVPSETPSHHFGSTPLETQHIENMSKRIKQMLNVPGGFSRRFTLGTNFPSNSCCSYCCVYRPANHRLRRIVETRLFEMCSMVVIIANAVYIRHASDYEFKHLGQPETFGMKVAEGIFYILYTVELFVRISACGLLDYFCCKDYRWNIFDAFLVGMSSYDQLASITGEESINLSFFRLARIFKVLRVVRMFRLMRNFRELRLIFASIAACTKTLTWSLLMLIIATFMFGTCFLKACTFYLANLGTDDKAYDQHRAAIAKYWSSVSRSMHTLYLVSTNGDEWANPADPLWSVSPVVYIAFMIYIAFFFFVLTNTITGLFVEGTMVNSDRDMQVLINEELKKKEEYVDTLRRFFRQVDASHEGYITYEDLNKHMGAQEMNAFSASLEIDATDIDAFFRVLSLGGTRSVDLETFVVGCIKLKGYAKSMDLMDLIHAHRLGQREHHRHFKQCREKLTDIQRLLQEKQHAHQATSQSVRSFRLPTHHSKAYSHSHSERGCSSHPSSPRYKSTPAKPSEMRLRL